MYSLNKSRFYVEQGDQIFLKYKESTEILKKL